MRSTARPIVLILATLAALTPASAAPPGEAERAARFIMQPVEGGVLRMDSDTGAMSLCKKAGETFACQAIVDEKSTTKDLERLQAENRDLKAEVKRLEDQLAATDPQKSERPGRRGDLKLPSEEDVDKALNYIERMVKKFRDRMKDFDGGSKGTPL